MDQHTGSAPPPSPVPPPPSHGRSPLPSGWTPADDDSSQRATDWRARKGLDRATRALAAISGLDESVKKLDATMARFTFWLKWAMTPILLAALGALGKQVYDWISTLHH